MSFLNAILLAGGAAFLVPLLIHLFNRRRVKVVRWGAMHLLHEVMRQRKRRIKIEQLLLLLTRIAIPIVLALCLARPVLSYLRQLPGLASTSLIVVLDTSYSMQAPSGSATAIQRARDDLQRIVQNLPQGSDVQVILAGGTPNPLLDEATSAFDILPERLSAVEAHSGPLDVQDAIQAALAAARSSKNALREVLVVSDFQRTDWKRLLDGAPSPALEQLASEDPKPAVTFYQIPSELTSNLHFASVHAAPSILAPGQSAGVRVQIRGEGPQPWQDVAVHLEADGARVKTTRASVPADGETTLYFSHAFDDIGEHTLTVRLDGDTLLEDNVWHERVEVREQLRVLLIEDSNSDLSFGGPLDFLELALSPHLSARTGLRDLIQTKRTSTRNVRKEDLSGNQVVVLADVTKFSRSDVLPALRTFVEDGGSLFVLPGNNLKPADYSREWFKDGKGLLPCPATGEEHVPSTQPPARLAIERFTHPALTYFNDARAAGLRDVEIRHWWKLQPDEKTAQVLLRLDRGAPLIVESLLGRGRVLYSAIAMDPDWSNLPLQPLFVPLAQRIIIHLALSGGEPSSATVGQSVQRLLHTATSDREFTFHAPDGTTAAVEAREIDGRFIAVTPAVHAPGIGRLVSKANPARPPLLAVWNLDPNEGAVTAASVDEMKGLAQRLNVSHSDGTEDYQRMDRDRRLGAEIWQPLLLAVLALLFFEVLLQQRIARA